MRYAAECEGKERTGGRVEKGEEVKGGRKKIE
jgi:hypothetical protein